MNYNQYDVDDFVADPFFNRWVKQADEESKIFWENWLNERPEKADIISQAKSIVAFLNFYVEGATQQDHIEVKTNIIREIRSHRQSDNYSLSLKKYFSIAAAISTLLIGGYFLMHLLRIEPYQQFTTDFGEQREVLLPDSTIVKMNANTSLKYSRNWREGVLREVWLEGEAFFEVVKKPKAADGRFVVHTQKLDVEVLGTTFNVEARHGETQVVLNSGKVKLLKKDNGQENQDIFLEPGEMATLKQDQWVRSKVNPQLYSSWKENRLFFENESIRNIAQKLEDTYGFDVEVAQKEWLDLKFTGSCPANDISILLEAIAESFDLKVSREKKQIRIHK